MAHDEPSPTCGARPLSGGAPCYLKPGHSLPHEGGGLLWPNYSTEVPDGVPKKVDPPRCGNGAPVSKARCHLPVGHDGDHNGVGSRGRHLGWSRLEGVHDAIDAHASTVDLSAETQVMRILYPDGIAPAQMPRALEVARHVAALFRLVKS